MKNIMIKTFAMMCLLGFHAVGFSEEPKVTEVAKPVTEETQASAEEKAKAAAEEKAKAVAQHGHSHD